jgi:hypothetical protein
MGIKRPRASRPSTCFNEAEAHAPRIAPSMTPRRTRLGWDADSLRGRANNDVSQADVAPVPPRLMTSARLMSFYLCPRMLRPPNLLALALARLARETMAGIE